MLWLRRAATVLKGPLISFKPLFRGFRISEKQTMAKNRLDVPESPLESADLSNGMKIICECNESCITTVGCFLPAGSIHEKPEERGASLFMEHLILKRTKCRSQEEIAKLLDQTGGKLGALAMRDMFLFYGSAPSCDIKAIIELLADIVLNGITSDEDIVAARFMIQRDLLEMDKDNERVVMDYLATIAYQGTDLGRSVYPDTCVLKNFRSNNVEAFRKRVFQPSFMTMISTGGTSFSDFQNLVIEYFLGGCDDSSPNEGNCVMKEFSCTPHFRFTGSEIRLRDDDEPFGHVAVAIEGPGHAKCQDHCTLTVAKEIMGSWDLSYGGGQHNSPYLAQCAFNSDMCHMYKSFNIGFSQTSLWGCYFVCEKMQLEDMLWMLQNEWMRLCSTITNKEVARAVNQCRTREIVRVNDSVDRFFDIATCIHRRGNYETFNERLSKFERVTSESIRDVANRYIYDQCPAVAALGCVENLPDYNRIRAYMYQIRH